jgi:hypothetical protein
MRIKAKNKYTGDICITPLSIDCCQDTRKRGTIYKKALESTARELGCDVKDLIIIQGGINEK